MDLPLAGVVSILVVGVCHALARVGPRSDVGRHALAISLLTTAALGLGAATMRRNQDYRSELAIWQDTVTKRPMNARSHYNLGIVLEREGKPDEASAHYSEAVRIDPTFSEAHNNLGRLFAERRRFEEAIAHLAEALRLEPKNAEAHNNLGNVLAEQGRIEEAIAHYEEALRLKPDHAAARRNLEAVRQLHYKND
jgi:tetratricopeptide (TPR) repeat protein